ncbi:two-component system sensor histidine kinase NtrB [Phosphitispora fastidiosa]|uniref:two-component system sensor histidine kinase NtrB n=1 Tax=Phosphitispora fastidiosa TaxID=2837202 RepID=UPI001E2AA198|nr:ATP-binding protein [Phosphitispora fastidiosa]MBU7007319.1 PAS domain S-box-containing protein [Phosphitispora fastidiosa]
MLLKNDIKPKSAGMSSEKPSGVLIADFSGKLKLAKWRLMSDGYSVYYARQLSEIENILSKEDIRVVLAGISGEDDSTFVENIKKTRDGLGIVAVPVAKGLHIDKALYSLNVRKVAGFPVDYPQLSAAVAAELEQVNQLNRQKSALSHIKRALVFPQVKPLIYQTAFDHIKTGILLLDTSGEILLANSSICSLLKIEAGLVIGKNFAEVIGKREAPEQEAVYGLIQEIASGRATVCAEIFNNTAADEPVPYEVAAHRVFSPKGEYIGMCISAADIRDFRKLEKAIARSERLVVAGQLAAGAAHEIRNPLTSVRGFIQLLKKELEGTPKEEYISIIISEIDRVNTIISKLLKLTKPAVLNKIEANISNLFSDIRVLMESEAFLKNITITENFPDSLPPVQIDCEQIKQVIINIVRNSFEAMPEGGNIVIRGTEREKERQVCLEISDTGEGMTEETIRQMFMPFFTTKDSGTGLGLAVSQAIVESHGGRLEVISKLGEGTKTRLYLPC